MGGKTTNGLFGLRISDLGRELEPFYRAHSPLGLWLSCKGCWLLTQPSRLPEDLVSLYDFWHRLLLGKLLDIVHPAAKTLTDQRKRPLFHALFFIGYNSRSFGNSRQIFHPLWDQLSTFYFWTFCYTVDIAVAQDDEVFIVQNEAWLDRIPFPTMRIFLSRELIKQRRINSHSIPLWFHPTPLPPL